jgi:uncharacterized membrane protein
MDPLQWFIELSKEEFAVIFTAALPIIELRGAIPLAIFNYEMTYFKAYILSVIGSLIPAPVILIFFQPVAAYLKDAPYFRYFFSWAVKRSEKRGNIIMKYSAVGLFLFVAVPIPTTGIWTGCMIASLFGMNFVKAMISVILGTLVSGFIVLLISIGII